MERQVKTRRQTQQGFSLVELTMAFAIFVVAAIAAYALYYAGTRSFKKAENVTALQQNARVGFDRMVRELRLAGFNHNSDGATARPDEQVEGAWDTAVTIRGDFDFEDATLSASPESTLDGTFNEVTVGNDEIVTYALGKPTLPGTIDISYVSDVIEVPRDGDEESVQIPGPVLVQSSPPYTLYRITPKNVAAISGFDGAFDEAAEFEYQAIAENIKSLEFRYYDQAGVLVNAATPADASDDIGGADGNRDDRASISRIEVELEAMTPQPDMEWVDPTDTNPATQAFRKVNLTATVNPRNMGMQGVPDIDLQPPSTPTGLTACVGHCGGTLLSWTDNPPNQGVSQYTVAYGTTSGNLTQTRTTGTNYVHVGSIDPVGTFFFAVRAEDAGGNTSAFSSEISATNLNNTQPGVVPGFAATASTASPGIQVDWTTLGQNDPTITGASGTAGCDIAKPTNRDLGGYALFREAGTSDPSVLLTDAYVPPAGLTAASTQYLDTSVIACRDYTYDIKALDACTVEGAEQASTVTTSFTTSTAPAAPTNVNASSSAPNKNTVVWDPVTTDANGDTVAVGNYNIYRAQGYPGIEPSISSFTTPVGSSTTTAYLDDHTSLPPSTGQVYYYRISALDDCPNESVLSASDAADCAFDGQVLLDPQDGDTVIGIVPITLASDGMDSYAYGEVAVFDDQKNVVFGPATSSTYPYTFSWNSLSLLPGTYFIGGRITNMAGCTKSSMVQVSMLSPAACCLSQTGQSLASDNKANSDLVIRLIANLCQNNLDVSNITVTYNVADSLTKLDEVRWNGTSITSGNNHVSPFTQAVSVFVPSFFNGGGEQVITFDFDRSLAPSDALTFDVTYAGAVVGQQTCSYTVVVGN